MARQRRQLKLPSQLPPIIRPRLLRRVQAAGYLNASASQFDLLRHDADFPAPILFPSTRNPNGQSRVPLWDVADLDAWIDRRKAEATSE